jgi:DNA primase
MLIKKLIRAQEFFIQNHNKKSLKYLYRRGFTDETIRKFGIGYNDDLEIFNTPHMLNCITIPYYDIRNRIVAFYCRSIDKEPQMKHMSSKSFPWLYEKGQMFYNLNRVIRKYYNGTVFIVEGQLDCISMAQIGFPNTIAICGNKMTQVQHEIIYRYFNKVYFVMDNDEPGKNMIKFWNDPEDDKHIYRKKYKNMSLYKIEIEKEDMKDVNDLLVAGVNIKKYFKRIKERLG